MLRRFIKNSGFLIILSCLTLLLAEVICRIYLVVRFHSPEVMYQNFGYERVPLLGFDMIPDKEIEYLPGIKTTYSTNSMGFRGNEEYGAKQKDEIRVAILGGSSAFGFGASGDETTIASILKGKLDSKFPSRTFSVINAGNPGYTSYQVLAKLQLKVIDLEPDIIVCYMGWNDLFFSSYNLPFERNSFYGKHQFFNMDSWQKFISYNNLQIPYKIARPLALSLIVHRAYRKFNALSGQKDHMKSIIISDELRDEIHRQFYDNLSSIAAISQYRKINTILITLFSEYDLYPRYRTGINGLIERVATESGAHFIDADEEVISSGIQGINIDRDKYHLTDNGNEFLAGLITEKISKILSVNEQRN